MSVPCLCLLAGTMCVVVSWTKPCQCLVCVCWLALWPAFVYTKKLLFTQEIIIYTGDYYLHRSVRTLIRHMRRRRRIHVTRHRRRRIHVILHRRRRIHVIRHMRRRIHHLHRSVRTLARTTAAQFCIADYNWHRKLLFTQERRKTQEIIIYTGNHYLHRSVGNPGSHYCPILYTPKAAIEGFYPRLRRRGCMGGRIPFI